MNVRQIFQGKDRFLDLLLLGDEQEDMIARSTWAGESCLPCTTRTCGGYAWSPTRGRGPLN